MKVAQNAVSKKHGHDGSRLILVSNRMPLSFRNKDGKLTTVPSSGGLIGALEPVLRDQGGIWIGSAGTENSPEVHRLLQAASRQHRFGYEPVFLTEEEQVKYYEGFSNEVLWPLFHDLQSRCVFDPEYWDFYQRVNRRFSDAIARVAQPSDTIWVHDYQLIQVAQVLRERQPDAFLSFFLHIPFPSPDIFGKLPWRREILEGLLDYDFVGLQTTRDERNLVASIRTFIPEARVTGRGDQRFVQTARGLTRIHSIPISIDFSEFDRSARAQSVSDRVRQIRSQEDMEIALGIDRLDYTKGIPERLRAFRVFLRNNPQFHRRVTLIQVVVPSRENIPRYRELRSTVERLVSGINGEFSEPGWTPIQYMHRSVPRQELIALYRAASIALITPLKDGMNLVAKEYCASHIDNEGVLILSEFAGAMPELHSGAIAVHPYDEDGIAAALRQALEMPDEERRRRMLRMRRQIRQADVIRWRDRIFDLMDRARPRSRVSASAA